MLLDSFEKKWVEIEGCSVYLAESTQKRSVYRTPHGKIHLVIKVC